MEIIDNMKIHESRKRTAAEIFMDEQGRMLDCLELQLMPDSSWEQLRGRQLKYYNIDHFSSIKIDKISIKRITETVPVTGYSYGQYFLRQVGLTHGSYYIMQFHGRFQMGNTIETISILFYEDGTYFYNEDSTIKNIETMTIDLKLIN